MTYKKSLIPKEKDESINKQIESLLKTRTIQHQTKKGDEVKAYKGPHTLDSIIRKLSLISGQNLKNVAEVKEYLKDDPWNLDKFLDVYDYWAELSIPVDKINDQHIKINEQNSLMFDITLSEKEIEEMFTKIKEFTI